MNFLQLTQRLSREAGISQSGPLSVVDQSGEYLMLVDWINDAYMSILRKPVLWNFMFGQFTFNCQVDTVNGGYLRDYDKTLTVGKPDKDTLTLWDVTENDEWPLQYYDYAIFRQYYDVGEWPDSRPYTFTILPSGNIRLGPKPDKAYTVTGDYRIDRAYLSGDTGTPIFDEEYHIAIVYRALIDHSAFIQDKFKIDTSAQRFKEPERQLVLEHSKDIVIGAETLA